MNAFSVYPETLEEFKAELRDLFTRWAEDNSCPTIVLPNGTTFDEEFCYDWTCGVAKPSNAETLEEAGGAEQVVEDYIALARTEFPEIIDF